MNNGGINGKFISKTKTNWSEIERKCRTKFGGREGPTVPGICKFIAKGRETGLIVEEPRRERARIPQELNILRTSLRRIFVSVICRTKFKSSKAEPDHQICFP